MIRISRSARCRATLAFAVALFAAMAVPAAAQTVGYADAIRILSQSCGNDIQKFCANVNLGGGKIQDCLARNSDRVSAQCKTDYVRVYLLLEQRFAAQQAAPEICRNDARRLCQTRPSRGHTLRCLLKAEPSVSKACNQAITDAGYR